MSDQDKSKQPGESAGDEATLASEAGVSATPARPAAAFDPNVTAPSLAGQTASGGAPEHIQARKPDEFNAEQIVGTELSSYKVVKKLAEGGMGVVYLGEHTLIGRRAAIKLLKPEFCQDEQVVQRFYQEARAVNTIGHENIVDIYDFGRTARGQVYFIMEFLEGKALSDRIHEGPIPFAEWLPYMEQTMRALKAAHEKGFVHRDLKPDNIYLMQRESSYQVKVLDFGIAKLVGLENAQEKLTRTGSIMGTPHYMSPEQIEGNDVDHRTDIYALGVILYELCTGTMPFAGDTLGQIIKGHLMTQAPRLENLRADLKIPLGLVELVAKSLEKDKADRFADIGEMLAALQDAAKGPLFDPKLVSKPTPKPKPAEPARAADAPSSVVVAPPPPVVVAPPPPPKSSLLGPLLGIGGIGALVGAYMLISSNGEKPKLPPPVPQSVPTENIKTEPVPEAILDYEQLRKDAQQLLRNSLREEEPAIRALGSDALAEVKDLPSTSALLTLVESDPDDGVKGRAAGALGQLGDQTAALRLEAMLKSAPPQLQVWIAGALAQLGSPTARKTLEKLAFDKDPQVAFTAALRLADVSKSGDKKAIEALNKLLGLGNELLALGPLADISVFSSLAKLGDPEARKLLRSSLNLDKDGQRIAVAEALARLGEETGREVLEEIFKNEASRMRLEAALVLIDLGDYSGLSLITEKLNDKDPETRRLAAKGLGKIGDPQSALALSEMLSNKEEKWPVRIGVAAALLGIVGLDPVLLAQASIDWSKSALDSADWNTRRAAASVLGDLPEKEALPLLARAMADPDSKVRAAAYKSSGRLKSNDAVQQLEGAVLAEVDQGAKEAGVKALGATLNPEAKDTLVTLSADPGRVGVFASGSLIAVGDLSAAARLETSIEDPKVDVRLAVVEAAGYAGNAVVVPAMVNGLDDKVFEVRFGAAEVLATYKSEPAKSIPLLEDTLDTKKDPVVQARATAALVSFGQTPPGTAPTAEALLDSNTAAQRIAALKLVEGDPGKAVPVVRRTLFDPETEVRRAGIEATDRLVAKDKEAAIKLYKQALRDSDIGNRTYAAAQLSKLTKSPATGKTLNDVVQETPQIFAPPASVPASVPASEPASVPVAAVAAEEEAAVLLKEVESKGTLLDEKEKKLEELTKDADKLEENADEIESLSKDIEAANKEISAAVESLEELGKSSTSSAVAVKVTTATKIAKEAEALTKKAKAAKAAASGSASAYIAQAEAALAAGKLKEAAKAIRDAKKIAKGAEKAEVSELEAKLYDAQYRSASTDEERLKYAKQALKAYKELGGAGNSSTRIAELNDDIKDLEAATAPAPAP